jgi:glycosyltransferase involved in cell wall biosynthesis
LSDPTAPAVSVVLATRDRADRLARALDAISSQRLEEPFELIVVDDASADETPAVLREREGSWDAGPIRVIRRPAAGGPAGARNTGWREASAPLVAFTDDDCEPTDGWLAALVGAAAEVPDGFVQGPTRPHPREAAARGPFSRTIEVRALGPWFPTCNVAYPRALLERLDGFDERLPRGEDTDLAWRAQELGAVPVWAPDAVVHHAVMEIGAIGRLEVAAAWRPAFVNFARHPQLREQLEFGLFWKQSHALLLLALLGLALARRFRPALLLAVPYAREVRARMAQEGAPPLAAPYYAVHDAVETATAVSGSLRHGTLVL